MAIFLIMVLVSLVFLQNVFTMTTMVAYTYCYALKKKDPAVRIVSAPGSVTDINMFHVVSNVIFLFNPPSAVW